MRRSRSYTSPTSDGPIQRSVTGAFQFGSSTRRPRRCSLRTRLPHQRRGTILVLFMLSLLLLSLTIGVLIRATMTQRNLVRDDVRRVQADWLVHSAAARAAEQLKNNSEYSGEQWSIPSDALKRPDSALAGITVNTDPESETRRLVTITVDYPPDSLNRVRVSRTIPVTVSTPPSN